MEPDSTPPPKIASTSGLPVVTRTTCISLSACKSLADWKAGRLATFLAASWSFIALAVEMPLMPSSLRIVSRITPSAVAIPASFSFLMSLVCTPKLVSAPMCVCVISMASSSSSSSTRARDGACRDESAPSFHVSSTLHAPIAPPKHHARAGGVGCAWARRAHLGCGRRHDILLADGARSKRRRRRWCGELSLHPPLRARVGRAGLGVGLWTVRAGPKGKKDGRLL